MWRVGVGRCVCVGVGVGRGERERGETLVEGERMRTPCNDRGGKKEERDPMQYSFPAMDFHLIHKKTI